jgi:SM-20-related protein
MSLARRSAQAGLGADALRSLGVFIAQSFLSGAECRTFASAARTAGESTAGLYSQGRGSHVDETTRRTREVAVDPGIRDALRARCEALLPAVRERFGLDVGRVEPPCVLRYRQGDFFKPHTDGGAGKLASRRIAVVIFLNGHGAADGYTGGELKLYGLLQGEPWQRVGVPVVPAPGTLVAFPADVVHEVAPVTAGERLTVVTWFHGGSHEPR